MTIKGLSPVNLQHLKGPPGTRKGPTQKTDYSEKVSNDDLFQTQAADFKMAVQFFSKTEFRSQYENYEKYVKLDLELTIAEVDMPVPEEVEMPAPAGMPFEDSVWGIGKTSSRLADFVIKGAGSDIDKMRQGREGIARGLKEAEEAWGGKLPDISYATMEKALEKIDARIHELGKPIIDIAS